MKSTHTRSNVATVRQTLPSGNTPVKFTYSQEESLGCSYKAVELVWVVTERAA